MAQAHRDGPAERPEDAVRVAEQVLRGLSQPSTGGPTAGTLSAIVNAERSVVDARGAADEIVRRLGLVEAQNRDQTIANLEQMRERFLRMGAQSVGDPELDRRHQDFIRTLIAPIDTALAELRSQRTATLGDAERTSVGAATHTLQGRVRVLEDVIRGQRLLTESGGPEEIRRHIDRALELHERGETDRARLLAQDIPREYAFRARFLGSDAGAADRQRLGSFVGRVADTGVRMTAGDVTTARTEFTTMLGQVDTHRAQALETERRALEAQRVVLQQLLARQSSEAVREQIRRILEATDQLITRMRDSSQGGLATDEDLRRISRRILGAQEMVADLERAPAQIRPQLGRAYAAGLDVLGSGGSYENFDAVMLAASEIKRASGTTRTATSYRADLVSRAEALRDATTDEARTAAQRSLNGRIATYMGAELQAEATRVTRASTVEAAAPIAQMASTLQQNPDQATTEMLQRGRMALEVGRRMTDAISPAHSLSVEARGAVLTIYTRALTSLATGTGGLDSIMPQVTAQMGLADIYARNGVSDERRQGILTMSQNLAEHPDRLQSVQLYLQTDATLQQLSQQRSSLPSGSPARAALDSVIGELESALGRMERGEGLADRSQIDHFVTAVRQRMATDPEIAEQVRTLTAQLRSQNSELTQEQAEAQAINMAATQIANAGEEQRLQELIGTATSMTRLLGTIRSGAQRADVGELFQSAVDAIIGRSINDGTAFRQAAETYARLTTDRDRADLMAICRQAAQTQAEPGARRFTEPQLRALTVYRQRAEYESAITDQTLLRNARAYFDLALLAARGQDPGQFQSVLDLAVLYGRMASVPEAQLTTAQRQQRTEGMAFVSQHLGNFSSIPRIVSGSRVLDIGAEGARGWTLPATSPPTQITDALLRGRSVYETLGGGNLEQGIAAFRDISTATARHTLNADDIGFERRAATILGRTDRDVTRAQSRYGREAERLQGLERAARDRGDSALADYYHRQAQMCNYSFVTETVAAARQIHASGRQDIESAMTLADEARGAGGATEEVMRRRIGELTAESPPDSRTGITQMLQLTEMNSQQMTDLARQVIPQLPQELRQGFIDRIRAAGRDTERLRGVFLEMLLTQLALQGSGDAAPFRQRIERASGDTAALRRLFIEQIYTQVLSGVAEQRMTRGRERQQQAGRIMDGLTQFDRSVQTIDTRSRESGRLELFVGIRSLIALANNRDVNMLGEFVGANGQVVQRVEDAGELTGERREVAQAQADVGIRIGTALIEEQAQIQRVRNQVVASAARDVRDRNVTEAQTMIGRMIDMAPADQQQALRDRLRTANARGANETETAFRQRQAREMQAILRDAAAASQVSITRTLPDGTATDAYDVERGYGDYRRVVGLAYSENFQGAQWELGRASARISSTSVRLGNRINQRELDISLQAIMNAPDRPAFLGELDRLRGLVASANAEGQVAGDASGRFQIDASPSRPLMEELLSHLPPDRRAEFERRLLNQEQLLATVPADQRRAYEERLRLTQYQTDPEGSRRRILTEMAYLPGAEGRRRRFLTELANESVPDPSHMGLPPGERRSVPLMSVAGSRTTGYYSSGAFEGRLDEVDRMIEGGNMEGAQGGLRAVTRDMNAAYYAQRRDTHRMNDLVMAARLERERAGVRDEFIENAPPATEDHPRELAREQGTREDRNEAVTAITSTSSGGNRESVVGAMENSYTRAIEDQYGAARSSGAARDEIIANAGNPAIANPGLVVDRALVGRVIDQLPDDQRQAFLTRLNSDPSLAGQIYVELSGSHPDAIRQAASLPEFSAVRSQLLADAEVTQARGRTAQRRTAWTFARLNIREGLTQLRMADMAQTTRDVSSDRTRAARDALDRVKGRAGQIYSTPAAHREMAARRFELALTMLDEANDFRAYDALMSNAPLTARVYEHRGSRTREWYSLYSHGTERLYVTVWNQTTDEGNRVSLMDSFGRRGSRSIAPVDELRAMNWVEMRELASYTDSDLFYDSRARIRPHLENIADMATDLQLAQVGIRRDRNDGADSDVYGYTLHRWQPTQEDLQRLAVLQQEFSQMRSDLQGSIFGFDSPWGDDPQLNYVARLDERMGHLRNGALAVMGGNRAGSYVYNDELTASAPYLTHVVEGGTLRTRTDGETRSDSDSTTLAARASMTNWQSGYRVTVAVGEFVVATAGVVLAPVTGGASLVLTIGVGAVGVGRGFQMRAQAGEWTGEAMFSVGMGALTIVLAPAGYLASGGRFLGSAGSLASELGTAARAAPTIGRFGRMVQVIEGTSGLSTEAAMAQTTVRQLVTRFVLGAPELGMGARAVHLTGAAMAFAGAGQFAYQMPRMMRAVERGEMAWFEAAWGGFQAFMQPLIQARAAQRFAARSVSTGIPEYVPRWRQFAQGMWTGNPMMDPHTHAIARDYHIISQQRSALSRPALASYDAHMQRFGIGLEPSVEASILTQYNQAHASGEVRNFQEFLARTPEARIAFLETVRTAHLETVANPEYQGPRIETSDLSEAGLAYVRARRRGASETDALAEVDAHAAEARVPAVRSAEDMYTQVRRGVRRADELSLPMQAYVAAREQGRSPARAYEAYQAARPGARARADEMRARTDRAAVEARAREQRTTLGNELNGQFTTMQGDNFVMGTGDHAIVVSPEHAALAGDLVFNAESILRRAPGESLRGAIENARTRIREQLIREGRDGTEADTIADQRMARVMELVRNPDFRAATVGSGGPNRAAQLSIGLRDAGYLPEIGSNPSVMRATNMLEARAIARNQDLTPADLDHFAIQRSGWAEERVAQAEALETEARGVESFDPARAASARERAQRLRNEAEAIDASADLLHGAAAMRREGARAEGMRSRASELEAQAQWEPQRAAELRAQAQALRADADRIAPVQPQGARVRVGPADATRLQVDMDLTIAVRAEAESYLGRATPGVEMRPGEAPRETRIIEGTQHTPEQARDASRSAAVADLIVSRRAQGTVITDEQIPGILRDLGLPQSLAPTVRSLTRNGEFILAVGLGNRERALGIAAGHETPQGLSPASVRRAIEIADAAVPQEAEPLNQAAGQRRSTADSLDRLAEREMARAAELEQTDPQGSAEASARAGALIRTASELRTSARRLSEQANALSPQPVRVAPTLVPPSQPQRRTRTPTSVVEESHPETIYAGDPVAQAIIRRGGARGQQAEWLIGGERVREGGVEQQVDTGRILRTIEDYTVTMARAGQESDVITISGDKRRLNQLNQMLGMENGDLALSAYREIMHRAVTRASEEGLPFLIRPSQSGDEVIGVILVRPGDGPAVRERLARILEEVTTQVFNERMSPSHPESLAHLTSTVRNPRDLVSAAIEVGQPVQVRRQPNGDVTARHMDGTDAMITRPDGRREFLPAMVRATDDPHFAPGLRQRTGVTPDTQITPGLEPVERARVQSAWERRGQSLNAADQAIVDAVQAEIRTRGLDATRPDDVRTAIESVSAARVRVDPTEVITTRSAAFEIRLEVTDPAVLADARGLLAETGKGLAEVLNNAFGLRGLNTFLGHYGANAVVNRVEAAVGAYAQQHGLSIRRLGTMKYIIEGGTPDQVAALHQFINGQLQQAGLGFRVSGRSQTTVVEPGTTGEAALSHVSNGHLVVERRADPARTSDWNGETRRYQDANALISAMAIGHDQALRTLLGDRYEALRPVIDLVRSRADIRNFEDLIFALRDSAIGGPNGRTLEGAFRAFVVDEGPAFRGRLEQVAPRPVPVEERTVVVRTAVGAEGQPVQPVATVPQRPPLRVVRPPSQETPQAMEARLGATPLTSSTGVRVEGAIGTQHPDVQTISRTAVRLAESDTPLENIPVEYRQMVEQLRRIIPEEARIVELTNRAEELNAEAERLTSVNSEDPRASELRIQAVELRGQANRLREETPSSVHVTVEGARGIIEPRIIASLEAATRGLAPDSPIAIDAAVILRAARGMDLTPEQTGRMIALPEEIFRRMIPSLTAEEAVAIARSLHPDGGGPQGGGRTPPRDNVIPLRPSQQQSDQSTRTVAQNPTEIASAILRGETVAVPQAMRDEVGYEIARQQGITSDARTLARFARDVVRGDAEATRVLESIPQGHPARIAVESLVNSRRFRNNAATDSTFDSYIGTAQRHGQGWAQAETARGNILRAMPDAADRARAAEAGVPPIIEQQSPVLQVVPQIVEIGGDRIVAMANQPPGSPPRGGGPRPGIIIGGEVPGGSASIPRRRATQPPPGHGIAQAELQGRAVTYQGISEPDTAGRSFHIFEYRGVEIAVPEGLSSGDLVRFLDRAIIRIHEDVEQMLSTNSQPVNPVVDTVAGERGVSTRVRGTMTALDQLAQLGTSPSARRPLDQIAPEYRDPVRRIREAYDNAAQPQRGRAAAEETYRQASTILSSRDQRVVPSSAQARELVALVEGRLQRQPRDGESIAAEGLRRDPEFEAAMARGDRDTAYRIAEAYGQLADAAERVVAPPALVEAQRTRMRAQYDSDPQVRAAVDREAAQRGITVDQFFSDVARTSVIRSEGRRIAREAQFESSLTSRSVSSERGETVTFGGARTGLPEAMYTGEQFRRAVSAATDAERVLTGEIRIDQVPQERRAAVQSLLNDGSFVAETRLAMQSGNRRTQLGMVLERQRMNDLFMRYADPAQRAGITDPLDLRAMQHISREVSAGRNMDEVIGEAASIAFDARRFSTMTSGTARSDFDRLMVEAVNQGSVGGADRQAVAFGLVRDIRAYAERLSQMRGPQTDPLDTFALEVAATTAHPGRPDMANFRYAAMVRSAAARLANDMLPAGNQGVIATADGSIDLHVTTGNPAISYRVRITESGATIEGARTGPIFGSERPASDPLAVAFTRYANSRITFSAAFGDIRTQLARGNFGEAARMAAIHRIGPQQGAPMLPVAAYAGMDHATIITTLQSTSTTAPQRQRALRSFAGMDRAGQDAVIGELHQQGRHNEANQLAELQAMNGIAGARLERAFGLRAGTLSDVYIAAPNVTEARVRLAQTLGINLDTLPWAGMPLAQRDWVSPSHRHLDHLAQDGFLFGMLTSGDMVGAVSEIFPGGRIESIAFQNGLVGAYRVRVVDANGETHTIFIKRQDLRPDMNGAEYSRAAGVPAADVIVSRTDGTALQYTMPDGSSSRYGILRNIADYQGTLRMAGRDIQVRTTAARSLGEIMQNPELMGQFVNDPQTFWREMGYALAGSYATGIYDRHEGNVWAMRMELVNPSTQDVAALRAAGYNVTGPDAQGHYSMFRIGGIDTDSGGTFLAQVSSSGGFDLGGMDHRFGAVDLHRLFVNMTRIRNEAERQLAMTQGRAPRYISVMDLVQQAFGQSGNGPLMSGIQRWMGEFGGNPQFRTDMHARFGSHDGDSSGMGVPLQPADHVRLANEGITYLGGAFNGEPNTPVRYADGRTIFMSRYDAVWTDGWPQPVIDMFPQNTEVYIVPLANLPQARIGSITAGVPNFTWGTGAPIAVFSSRAQIPPDLAGRAIPATRHGNVVRTGHGLQAAGIPAYEFGAAPVFDYILSDPTRLGRHFDSIYRTIMTTERDAHNVIGGPDPAAQQRYLQERLPAGAVGNIHVWPTFDRPF